MSNFAESIPPELESDFFPGYSGRRFKAAFAILTLWLITAFLHLVTWGHWAVSSFTLFVGLYLLRVILAKSPDRQIMRDQPGLCPEGGAIAPTLTEQFTIYPQISLLVAAKNEASVIASLVKSLVNLDYPQDRFDLWFIDDNSSDQTGEILAQLSTEYPQLNVVHRGAGATGGKSGALNGVWPRTRGEILVVFDADAQVPRDLLQQVVPLFASAHIGAVQVRKAIINAQTNFWTLGQQAEMALDAYYQQQRVAVGGLGELRGNGQFVRRAALSDCGGWNEETITDDLDLTLQLHLRNWDIAFVSFPAVEEEGVTQGMALWHQRNRWAEGGYQRYLDYWRLILRNRLGPQKSVDLFVFWVLQYMLPMITTPDVLFAIARHRLPLFGPLTTFTLGISCWGMFVGIRRTQKVSIFNALWQTLRGTVYMFHWVLVMSTTTVRIAIRPKRLKWVKTARQQEVVGI